MDEDELDEWSDILGISPDEVEDLFDAIGSEGVEFSYEFTEEELDDYLNDLADLVDLDVSDLYDMYYGYTPGSSES